MDLSQFQNPYLIGVIMALMVGPVFFILIKTSIINGVRAALTFEFGAIFCDILFILLAYFGSRPLLESIQNDPRLTAVGGLILLGYGLFSYFDPKNKKENIGTELKIEKSKNYFKLFTGGFLLNFINIGVLAGWLGIMVIVGPSLKMEPNAIFWFFVKVLIGFLLTDAVKIFLAKQLQKKMTPLVIYRMKKGMGVILIIFGLAILLKPLIFKFF